MADTFPMVYTTRHALRHALLHAVHNLRAHRIHPIHWEAKNLLHIAVQAVHGHLLHVWLLLHIGYLLHVHAHLHRRHTS